MKKILVFLLLTGLLFAFTMPSQAGWWIFGQGTDEIVTNYIYINQNSIEESGQEITLFRESLKDGNIRINGKASVRNAKIGAVFVSLDNKASWQKANVSNNGYFEYIFTPEIDREYDFCVKIVDTLGKTNDIDSTYRKVKVVDENISDKVFQTLNDIREAYQNEDPGTFMKYVSDNFAGGYGVLDFAVRKDFTAFDYIEMQLYVNNISRSSSGKVYVAVQYNRKVVSSRTGDIYTDKGFTEFVFNNENGMFKISSMKNPLLFGLSDAGEVATGTIQNTGNDPMLLVDSTGTVDAKPFRTAIDIIENDAAFEDDDDDDAEGVISGTVVMNKGPSTFIEGYEFLYDSGGAGDVAVIGGLADLIPGNPDIDTVTTAVPAAGAAMISFGGLSYSIQLPDGKYMLLQHTGGSNFKYRFQPNGTPNF